MPALLCGIAASQPNLEYHVLAINLFDLNYSIRTEIQNRFYSILLKKKLMRLENTQHFEKWEKNKFKFNLIGVLNFIYEVSF